jgi:hypothetical protein
VEGNVDQVEAVAAPAPSPLWCEFQHRVAVLLAASENPEHAARPAVSPLDVDGLDGAGTPVIVNCAANRLVSNAL